MCLVSRARASLTLTISPFWPREVCTMLPYSFTQVRQYRELVEIVHKGFVLRKQISQLEEELLTSASAAGNLSVAIAHKELTAKRAQREAQIRQAEELASDIA